MPDRERSPADRSSYVGVMMMADSPSPTVGVAVERRIIVATITGNLPRPAPDVVVVRYGSERPFPHTCTIAAPVVQPLRLR